MSICCFHIKKEQTENRIRNANNGFNLLAKSKLKLIAKVTVIS
jgi:hypothetical protein